MSKFKTSNHTVDGELITSFNVAWHVPEHLHVTSEPIVKEMDWWLEKEITDLKMQAGEKYVIHCLICKLEEVKGNDNQ